MGKKSEVHLYVDGSSLEGKNAYGLGWAWSKNKGIAARGEKLRVKIDREKPEIAHIYAAARGLETLTQDAGTIIVHSTNPLLCKVLDQGIISKAIGRTKGDPSFRKAWRALETAIDGRRVTAVLSTDTEGHMPLAHKHAITAAEKPFNEAGRPPKKAEAVIFDEMLYGRDDRQDYPPINEVA